MRFSQIIRQVWRGRFPQLAFFSGLIVLPMQAADPPVAPAGKAALKDWQGNPIVVKAGDPLFAPAIQVELGPEGLVSPGSAWPYLFQSAEGTTIALGHKKWVDGLHDPIPFTVRSFDGRKTWEEWKPAAAQGPGPVTEGTVLQMPDGRILIFNIYFEHVRDKLFEGKLWVSADGGRTISGPEAMRVEVPDAEISNRNDRGDVVSRINMRRSMVRLPGGDLLASAYGLFKQDRSPVEYPPLGGRQPRSYLLRSRDEGRTWAFYSNIAVPPNEQEGFAEPVLVQLKHGDRAGRLICQMRSGRENPVYQTESDDEGKSWTQPRPLRWTYSRFGRQRDIIGVDPDLIEMSDGTLVMSYGHKPDYQDHGNFLAFSLDQGATWIGETRLNWSITSAYTGVREVNPGTLFVIYSNTAERQASKYRGATFNIVGRTVVVKRTGK